MIWSHTAFNFAVIEVWAKHVHSRNHTNKLIKKSQEIKKKFNKMKEKNPQKSFEWRTQFWEPRSLEIDQ